jgi:O-antigen/teichoic acid export membrane protein
MLMKAGPFYQLLGSAYATQLLPIVFLPILTRLYSPAAFGDLLIFSTSYIFIGTFATGKYETSLLMATSRNEAFALMKIVFALCASLSLAAVSLIWGLARFVSASWTLTSPFLWLALLYLSAVSFSALLVLTAWNNRNAHYKNISLGRLVQSLLTSLIPILIYGFRPGAGWALILAQFAGVFGATILLLAGFPWKAFLSSSHSRTDLAIIASKYKANSLYGLPHALADNIFPLLIAAVVSHKYGLTELGFYNICLKFKMPFTAVASSIGMLRQKDIIDGQGLSAGSAVAHEGMRRTLFFGLLLSPLLLFAPIICKTLLAARWERAGYYVLICSPVFVLSYLIGTFGSTAYLLNRQQTAFRFGLSFNAAQFLPFAAVFLLSLSDAISMRDALIISSLLCSAVLVLHLRWLLIITSDRHVRQCA